MLEYIVGNLLETEHKYIAHGCNARGVMGSGVAKAIKDKYPEAFGKYRIRYNEVGLHVGDVIYYQGPDKHILNCITQEFYGRENICYVSYEGLTTCMEQMDKNLGYSHEGEYLAMPKIGAGLANGDWSIISDIIEKTLKRLKPIIYVLDAKEIP